MYEDKKIVCVDCGEEFTFEAGEQEYYAKKGFTNDPKRCKSCIKARKAKKGLKYTIICDECGCEGQVPFEPKEGAPVYCSSCFAKRSNAK